MSTFIRLTMRVVKRRRLDGQHKVVKCMYRNMADVSIRCKTSFLLLLKV